MTPEMSNLFRALSIATVQVLKKRLVMTSSDRTCSTQRIVDPGVLDSYHLNGQAFDAQVIPYKRSDQAIVGHAAERLGFRWGGSFAGYYDDVHFDNGRRAAPGRCPS